MSVMFVAVDAVVHNIYIYIDIYTFIYAHLRAHIRIYVCVCIYIYSLYIYVLSEVIGDDGAGRRRERHGGPRHPPARLHSCVPWP